MDHVGHHLGVVEHGAIAPQLLRRVEGLVAGQEQVVGALAVVREARDPDAHRQRCRGVHECRLHRAAQPLGHEQGVVLRGLGQHQRELLPAEPGRQVDVAGEPGHLPCEALQHLVAAGVPEQVVDPLEVIQVGDQEAHRAAPAARPLELELERFLERTAVAESRQRIGVGGRCQAADQVLHVRLQGAHEHPRQRHGAHRDEPLLLGGGRALAHQHQPERHSNAHELHQGRPAREEVDGLDRDPDVEERVDAGPLVGEVDGQRHQHGPDQERRRDLGFGHARAAQQQVETQEERGRVDRQQARHVGARGLGKGHGGDRERRPGRVGVSEKARGAPRIVQRCGGGLVARPGVEALPERRCPGPHVKTYRPPAAQP